MLRIKNITRTPIGIAFGTVILFAVAILSLFAGRYDWQYIGFWLCPFVFGFFTLKMSREEWREEWELLFYLFREPNEEATPAAIRKEFPRRGEKIKQHLLEVAKLGLVERSGKMIKLNKGVANVLSGLQVDIANIDVLCEKLYPSAMLCQPIFKVRPEIFKERNEKKLCFVLMPFAQELRPVFDLQIKPTVEKLDYSCMRADDFWGPHEIMKDVYENILRASFIIADLTRRNPNVFYEIGLAHLIGKPTILIAQIEEDVPFDLRPHRYFKYEWTPEKMNKLGLQLERSINSMQKEGLI